MTSYPVVKQAPADYPDKADSLLPEAAAKQSVGMGTQVARGSLWSLGGQGVTMLASLITTPLVIRLLGTEAYGVLALINLLTGYIAFSDLGMGTASTRFGADAHARSDDESEAAVVWSALLICFAPALLAASCLGLAAEPLLQRALRLPPHLHTVAVLALRLATIGFVARSLAEVLNTPQLVRLRMRLNTTVKTASSVAQSFLVPTVLWLGGGLVGAVAAIASVGVLTAVGQYVFSQRLLPVMARPRIKLELLRPLAKFGGAMVASTLAFIALTNVEKFFLTRYASVKDLAYYMVAFSLASLLLVGPHALGQSLLPAFTRLWASGEHAALQQLYNRALRAILLWMPPVVLATAVGAQPFLTVWAGAEFGQHSPLLFYILVAGLIFNVASYAPFNIVLASGKAHLVAQVHLSELLPYLCCAAGLSYWLGAPGAAIAWSLRVAVDALLFALVARRLASVTIAPFVGQRARYLWALAVLVIPNLLAIAWAAPLAGRIAVALLTLLLYVGVVWRAILKADEREWIKNLSAIIRVPLSKRS